MIVEKLLPLSNHDSPSCPSSPSRSRTRRHSHRLPSYFAGPHQLPRCSFTGALVLMTFFTLFTFLALLLSPALTFSHVPSSSSSSSSSATSAERQPSGVLSKLQSVALSQLQGKGNDGEKQQKSSGGAAAGALAGQRAGRVGLHVITLAFNSTANLHAVIDHNCALITAANRNASLNGGAQHRYVVHTDDLSRAYCRTCECVRYAPIGCECPHPSERDCPLCEKLDFVVKAIQAHDAFVFLDADVVLLRGDYLDLLSSRTHDFDFLAMYDDWGGPCKARYTTSFNSGLMFVRRVLPGPMYDELRSIRVQRNTNDDQGVISYFVQQHYERWDTLSLRWHCRSIFKPEKNIPPHHCYAAHMREPARTQFLKTIKYTLLTTGST